MDESRLSVSPADADDERTLDQILSEVRDMLAQMREDQREIERLKRKSAALSAETDGYIREIYATLANLHGTG